jgi:amino acid adenylation domain-containing protein
MSEVIELVRSLRDRGIRLWSEDGQLRYSAPPGGMDEDIRARVRAQRDALIAWLAQGQAPAAAPRALPRDGGPLPASLAQSRMFFLDRIAPGAYHCPAAIALDDATDDAALQSALDGLVARHEALRTRFRLEGAELAQIVDPPAAVELRRLHADDPGRAQALADAFFAEAFDLQHGAPLRAALLVCAGTRTLLLCLHHIVVDGWSIGVLGAELRRAIAGETLSAPAWQYAEFADWQRRELDGRIRAGQLPWWLQRLADAPAALDLPTDRPRPAVFPTRGALHRSVLGAGLEVARIEAAAAAAGVTPFMLLLAAFQALLHRWTAAEDLCIGTPVANRVRPEFAGTIGCFVNTVVLRAAPAADTPFADFLQDTRHGVVDAFDRQELPFELLVEQLGVARDPSRHPLFQAMFVLQTNEGAADASLAAAQGPVRAGVDACKFDLNVAIAAVDGRYHLECEYAADLYDAATVERLFRHYGNLLRDALARPQAPLGQLQYLDAEDRAELERIQAGPVRPLDPEDTVLRRFERRVAVDPQAIALRCGDRSLGYAELDAEADALAAQLRAVGVRPGAVCALMMERSVAMVRAILASLKCGAAWLPIDPGLPAARIDFILRDAGVAALMVQAQADGTTPPAVAGVACPVLVCGEEPPPAAPAVAHAAQPEDWAYVLYTSGTTGQPKGVVNHHAGLANRIDWMQRNFPIGPGDVVLQKTNYAFDVSVWEFVWPLTEGATLAMAAPGRHGDPLYLADCIAAHGVTVMHFVPSMMAGFASALSDDARRRQLASLRAVFASGEALSAKTAAAFRALGTGAKLFNLYGPTEAAIDVTVWDCDDTPPHPDIVPLGRPIDNIEIRILDAQGAPVAVGVCGELCIGGVGLATGYLARPALTATSFVPHPERPGARLYRTGDRARWRAEGILEYFGRLDFQVKLRGLRIELGEVETQLMAQPGVVNAGAVVVRAGGSDEQYLIAYVEAAGEDAADPESRLKDALRGVLPDYMVPHRIVVLERLPLNANGKLDRKALMQRPLELVAAEAETVAAEGDVERRVHDVWAGILGVDTIGVTRNLFDAGATSLLMIAAQQKFAAAFGREIALVKLFAHPTIRGFAAFLAELRRRHQAGGAS